MKTNYFFRTISIVFLAIVFSSCNPCEEMDPGPPTCGFGSGVPISSCTITPQAENYFRYEAAQLAVEQLFADNHPDTSQVFIQPDYYNAYIKALGLIYDATSIPQRDSVINMNLICQWNETYSIMVGTGPNTLWAENWVNNIIPTGNTTVDNAISAYNLSISPGPQAGPTPWYIIGSNQPINGIALSSIFITLPNVVYAEPNTHYSFYSKLTGSFSGDVAHIIFYEGWGDCPSGCFGYHQWEFDVDLAQCTVTFTGYYP